jgi:alpha-beta hydrolase superfamily lysophospholipase
MHLALVAASTPQSARVASMAPILVTTELGLHVSYRFYEAQNPQSDSIIALHHGICHTHEQFEELTKQLNGLGMHAAMISQQSGKPRLLRNCIGIDQYVAGMKAAVKMIERRNGRIGSYAFHSMGALVGEEMQAKYPDLRRPTVLMAPIPVDGALPVSLRILKAHTKDYLNAVRKLSIQSLASTHAQVHELFFDPGTPWKTVETTRAQLQHAPFWMYIELVFRWLARPRIPKNESPKMLLRGENDYIFREDEYKKTRSRYRSLDEHKIAGGHDFFIENAERTAGIIANFHKAHAAIEAYSPKTASSVDNDTADDDTADDDRSAGEPRSDLQGWHRRSRHEQPERSRLVQRRLE